MAPRVGASSAGGIRGAQSRRPSTSSSVRPESSIARAFRESRVDHEPRFGETVTDRLAGVRNDGYYAGDLVRGDRRRAR